MYFWNSYPFVRLSIILISGIFCFEFMPVLWVYYIPVLGVLFVLFAISLILSMRAGHYQFRIVNGAIVFFIFFLLGGGLVAKKYVELPGNHYSKVDFEVHGFYGTIINPASERTNHFRYDFEIQGAVKNDSTFETCGTIHLYVRKDTVNFEPFEYGDQLMVAGKVFPLSEPGNPYEFDFKKYLHLQGIYAHSFIQKSNIKKIGHRPGNRILQSAFMVREKAAAIIDKNIRSPRENGIAKALLLGIKDHLDNEVKKSYSAAGAMHVLAVSGLHVGIVYLFLQFLFGKLKTTKTGRVTFSSASIIIIWCYALITGLSPSVLRAATMFSIVALGEINATKGNVYNSLGLAAFILLLTDPYLIYSVGFQLSFSAVFGIVYLQPRIYRLLEFNFLIIDKAWAITSVSIAAQIATFPLTAYYFHQFPTYFLISNLVVIPAATIMLVGGVCMLLIDPIIGALGELVGSMLSKIIWCVNESVSLVESLPNSLIGWIYLDLTGLVLTFSIVTFLTWGLHFNSFKSLLISALLFLSFLALRLNSINDQSHSADLIFYELKGRTAIDHIEGHKARLYIDEIEGASQLLAYQVNPNRLASGLKSFSTTSQVIDHSERFAVHFPFTSGILAGKKILLIDSVTFDFQFDKIIETDVLIIENGSVKNLNWLLDHFKFHHLLTGNKNTRFYSSKMKQQARSANISIHSLIEDGAFTLDVRK
ncbi:MAG: ComEC/Rec2 family competence protein [Cyclobacteriaceae bacterium]